MVSRLCVALLLIIVAIWYNVILNLLCKFIFFYFYCKIIKYPLLNYIICSLDGLNIFNVILLLIVFIISTYLGLKLFNLLKNFILYVYINDKSFKYIIMQANPGPLLGLLSLSTNTSTSSLFHARKAYFFKGEKTSLTTVLLKLDREQPHPSGVSRLAAFSEYIHEIDKKLYFEEYWANRHYYRGVVMNELENRSKSSISDTASDTSSVSSIVSWLS